MNALHSEIIRRLSLRRFGPMIWTSFLSVASVSSSDSWLPDKARRAWSLYPLDEHIRRSFELISVIALVELLLMLQRFIDLNPNILIDFSHKLLLLSRLLDSLLHETQSLRDDLPVKFEFNFLSFDSVVDFTDFDRKQVHHVVVPHYLLVLLPKLVVQISHAI